MIRSIVFGLRKSICIDVYPLHHGIKNLSTNKKSIDLFGVKEDRNSSFMEGPAAAPPLIRASFYCKSGNSFSESGLEIHSMIKDFGDITPNNHDLDSIYDVVSPIVLDIFKENRYPLILGI